MNEHTITVLVKTQCIAHFVLGLHPS